MVFLQENYTFAKNTIFNSKLAKELPNAAREALQEPLGEPRAPPGSLQTINFSRQEAPKRQPMNFFSPRRAPRAAPRGISKGFRLEGRVREGPGGLWGSILEPPGLHFGTPGAPFWSLRAWISQVLESSLSKAKATLEQS